LENWLGDLNPHSKAVIMGAYAVPSLATAVLGDKFQFERLGNLQGLHIRLFHSFNFSMYWFDSLFCPDAIPGYFAVDTESTPEKLVFNRTVTLRDTYGKAAK
jgi:glutaminyl-tRNA synthetase